MRRTSFGYLGIVLIVAAISCEQNPVVATYRIDRADDIAGVGLISLEDGGRHYSKSANVMIDKWGSVVELDDGSCIEIPEGTVEVPTEITFASESITYPFYEGRKDEIPIGPVMEFRPELRAPMNSYITISIPFDDLPYCYNGCDIYLAARETEWPYEIVYEAPVSANWTYTQAGIYGDRLVCLLDDIHEARLQFLVVNR